MRSIHAAEHEQQSHQAQQRTGGEGDELARRGLAGWDLYYDVKDPVCDAIMVAAADWAGSVGWRTEPYS
jgi:hypothetical protein